MIVGSASGVYLGATVYHYRHHRLRLANRLHGPCPSHSTRGSFTQLYSYVLDLILPSTLAVGTVSLHLENEHPVLPDVFLVNFGSLPRRLGWIASLGTVTRVSYEATAALWAWITPSQ